MHVKSTIIATMLAVAALSAQTNNVHAGGWIADKVIKPVFGKRAAREADKLHELAGKPGDAAVRTARKIIFSRIAK